VCTNVVTRWKIAMRTAGEHVKLPMQNAEIPVTRALVAITTSI
jgi:hypothetical protein